MSIVPKLFLPKFHTLASPIGYISLHEALNRLGRARYPSWGIDSVWKSHPYFYRNKEFRRWVVEKRTMKCRPIRFKPDSEVRAIAAARIYAKAVTELSEALQSHIIVGFLLGSSDTPIEIPHQSIQWVQQGRPIFSTGYMRRDGKHLRIVLWEDEFDNWLTPKQRSSKEFNSADDEFIKAAVDILNTVSARHEHFRFTSDALWKLLGTDLSHHMKRSTFRDELFNQVNETARKIGRGAPKAWELNKFDEQKKNVIELIGREIRLLQARTK